MDRDTRDKFVSGTGDVPGNSCWETPPAIFKKLNEDLSLDLGPFDLDLTADPNRYLCPNWFGPGSWMMGCEDALSVDWSLYGKRGYSNPPYGTFVPKLLKKAKEQSAKGFSSVILLPLRVTVAFKEYVLNGASRLLFCDKRICFWENGHPRWNKKGLEKGQQRPDPALFDSILVVYEALGVGALKVGVWKVPPHVLKEDEHE